MNAQSGFFGKPPVFYDGDVNISLQTVRLFIHIFSATIWVGGQMTLAGLVPTLRSISEDAPRKVARRFNQIAWPAFFVLTFTGIWNALAIDMQEYPASYRMKFGIKMTCYLITGFGAALHSMVKKKWAMALGGAAAGLGAVATLFFAVSLKY